LQHLMLGTLSHEEYIKEWVHNYGVWRRELGEELWDGRGKSAVDPRYFQFAMLRSGVERSRGVIVHNPGAAVMARAHGATKVFTIPHFFDSEEGPGDSEAMAFRQGMGIDPAVRLFGIFGFLRETKRVPACMTAFRRLHALRPWTALLIAGDAVSNDLARLLESEEKHPSIYRTGHLSDRELKNAAAAVDCGLNLRYPGAGETSGIAIRLMGTGKPVIGTDNAENGDIPGYAMLRVRPGIAETAELFEHMLLVAEYPDVAKAIGNEARSHIQKRHGLETVVRQYWEALCAVTS
jgi:glycosyltransferase involved in cell wall biosynthesis